MKELQKTVMQYDSTGWMVVYSVSSLLILAGTIQLNEHFE
jgi:hypothetical protein